MQMYNLFCRNKVPVLFYINSFFHQRNKIIYFFEIDLRKNNKHKIVSCYFIKITIFTDIFFTDFSFTVLAFNKQS